jgi:Family of unknown function (DUF5372)
MVRVTHRFHPLFGRVFPFVKRHRSWEHDRVYVTGDGGALMSLPVEWTDLAGEDPFVVVAGRRSPFRTQDLLDLAALMGALGGSGPAVDDVERILP